VDVDEAQKTTTSPYNELDTADIYNAAPFRSIKLSRVAYDIRTLGMRRCSPPQASQV